MSKTEYLYTQGNASRNDIERHLVSCDFLFKPSLSSRLRIPDYAKKLYLKACCHECWFGSTLVGLISFYHDSQEVEGAYITNVSVCEEHQARGIAECLLKNALVHMSNVGTERVTLEVSSNSEKAISLYRKYGFFKGSYDRKTLTMCLELSNFSMNS